MDNEYIGRIVKIKNGNEDESSIYLSRDSVVDIKLENGEEVLARIIECINEENRYKAIILSEEHKNEKFFISRNFIEGNNKLNFSKYIKTFSELETKVLDILDEV